MSDLKKFADSRSQFLRFGEDGAIEGVFEGAKIIIKDSFGEQKEVVRYTIDGKFLDSQSASLALQMDGIPPGTRIRITRTGQGTRTKYKVQKISPDGLPF